MRLGRVGLALLGAWLLVVGSAVAAQAHAGLEGTDPPDGAVLPEAPATLTLSFTEAVVATEGGIVVVDGHGTETVLEARSVDTDVVVDLPPLADGGHLVSWRVVSGDGHPVSGAFTFTVGEPVADDAPGSDGATAAPPAPAAPPSSAGVHGGEGPSDLVRHGLQTAIHLGVIGAGGLVLFEAIVLAVPRGSAPALRRRLRRWTLGASVVGTLALLACVPVTAAWQSGRSVLDPAVWGAALDGTTTAAMGIGAVGTALAGIGVVAAGRGAPGARQVALGGAVVGMLSLVGVGHTRTVGPAALVVTADALHVLVAAVWFGGLIGLVVTLARASDAPVAHAARTVSRFSGLAAVVVTVLALTGVVLGWRILGSVDLLFTTDYGRALLVKVGVAGVILLLAGWNRFRLVPRVADDGVARRRLRRTVSVEAGLLAGVLAITAVLVAQSPTAPAAAVEDAAGGPVTVEREIDEGHLSVTVQPGVRGTNEVLISLRNPAGAAVDAITPPQVGASLQDGDTGALSPEVHRTGLGQYHAAVELMLPGTWEIALDVRTSDYVSSRVVVEVDVP